MHARIWGIVEPMKFWRGFAPALILLLVAVARVSPALADGGDAARGAAVYARHCAACHGARGEGGIGATLAKEFASVQGDAFLSATIARGIAGSKMPAWSRAYGGPLTNEESLDVVAYVRALSKPTPPTPSPSVEPAAGSAGALVGAGLLGVTALVFLGVLLGTRERG